MSNVISVEVHSEIPSSPVPPELPPDLFVPPKIIPLERQSTIRQVMTGGGEAAQSGIRVVGEAFGASSNQAVQLKTVAGNHHPVAQPAGTVFFFLPFVFLHCYSG